MHDDFDSNLMFTLYTCIYLFLAFAAYNTAEFLTGEAHAYTHSYKNRAYFQCTYAFNRHRALIEGNIIYYLN